MTYAHPHDPPRNKKLARELGRAVARGWLADPIAQAVLTMAAVRADPEHPMLRFVCTRLTWIMRDAAQDHAAAIDRAKRRVRYAIQPMCDRRMPGSAILAEAERIGGEVLRRHELVEICRSVAAQSKGGRHGGR